MSVAAGLLITASPPVHAAGPNIVAVGSDTIQNVDDALLSGSNLFNIHAAPTSPQTVPADGVHCSTANTYAAPPVPGGDVLAPNGSGNGREALKQGSYLNGASPNDGCVSIARSSGSPRANGGSPGANGTDSAGFQYYAFAMDAVSWGSPSLNAPAVLTPAQLLGIYNCTFTNWAQVGGGSGAIQRYEPQPGSGTRSFFESSLLGGLDPTTISTPSCPAVVTTQANGLPLEENTGSELDAVNYQKAILPYSGGQWSFQSNNRINPTVDFRNGVRLGGIVATRKANNFRSITDGTTTNGSTTVGSAGSNFQASDAGAPISGSGIPSGDVVQSVAGDNSSVTLASSGSTRTVTDGVTNKTVNCVNTTNGSTAISINTSGGSCPASPAVSFVNAAAPAGDVGAVLSIGTGNGSGIPDGSTIVSVTDATHAVISTPATSTNNSTLAGVSAITLNLDGGAKTISSVSANFTSGDVGKIISGTSLPAATAITGVSGDGSTAYLSKAVTAANMNLSGRTFLIDDPAATATGASIKLSIGTSMTTNASTTLTATNAAFTSFDVGAAVTGGGVPAGATIASVTDATHAVLSAAANATATTSVTITDLSENTAFWTSDGTWVPNITSALQDPRGPIAESNISLNNSSFAFPGVRYVFHVVDTANPYYSQALTIVGFDNSIGGAAPTGFCNGSKGSTIGSFGFAKLDTSDPGGTPGTSGPNITGTHCRRFLPS
jgi:hypothetical protein